MKFRVMIEQDEDGELAAHCPSLPGCVSDGKDRQEALASLKKHNEPIPPPIEEETVEVSA